MISIATTDQRAKPIYRTISVTSVVPAIGADISGADLSAHVSDEMFREIHDALLEHLVIFVHNQNLSPSKLVEFARRFGDLQSNENTSFGKLQGFPEIEVLDYDANRPPFVTKEMWHTDFTGHERPTLGALLYALEVPKSGGDTIWLSLYQAYDALSPFMKKYLSEMKAEHHTIKSFGDDIRSNLWRDEAGQARRERIVQRQPAVHPVVRTHPVTGRKALFVNEGYTTRLLGVERKESDAILGYLFEHLRTPEFQCRFHWRKGTLVIWDNRVTQHYAVADYSERRLMHRIAIKGDHPY